LLDFQGSGFGPDTPRLPLAFDIMLQPQRFISYDRFAQVCHYYSLRLMLGLMSSNHCPSVSIFAIPNACHELILPKSGQCRVCHLEIQTNGFGDRFEGVLALLFVQETKHS
jgi:hypothetical protein